MAGVLGLGFLRQTLHRLTSFEMPREAAVDRAMEEAGDSTAEVVLVESDSSALDMPSGQTFGRHTRLVFACWMIVFALVGAQMGWVLRPFVGSPDMPFSWFRERGSNFFEALLKTLGALLTGSS